MMGRHQHTNWTPVGAAYTPPAGTRFTGISETVLARLMQGFTNVSQQCGECGYIEVRGHTGRVTIPGVPFVDATGPQDQRIPTPPPGPGGGSR